MEPLGENYLNMEEYLQCAQAMKIFFKVQQPVGYFSVTEERLYCPNASQLKLLNYPKPEAFPLDLSGKLETRHRKTLNHFYEEYLDNLLFGISDHRDAILCPYGYEGSHGLRVKGDIVCQMELLQTVMCTPFKLNVNWKMLAINYRDTLYLALENVGEQPWTEEQKKKSSMEAILKHKVYSAPNDSRAEECSEFNFILSSQMNNLSLIYSVPINGGAKTCENLSHADIMNLNFFECKFGENRRRMDGRLFTDLYTAEEALMWWSESHLKGARSLMLALANPYGRVQSLEPISCEKLRRNNKTWSADFCQQFLSQFLSQVRESMRNVDDHSIIYEFTYVAQKRCIYKSTGSGQRLSFIPAWYRLILEDNE